MRPENTSARLISTTAPMMIAAETSMRGVMVSCASRLPRIMATTGLTSAPVAPMGVGALRSSQG